MAATYTHQLFTQDVYQALDEDIKSRLDIDVFHLFGKSFDALFFYKPKLASMMHKSCVNLYFANIIDYLRHNNETHNRELLSYLYGSICHYVLDSTVHPFVYYYGGKVDKKNPKTYLYRGRHDYIETMIDAIMCIKRYHKKIHRYHVGKKVFPKIHFSSNLAQIIDKVYKNTFQIDNGFKIYYKSYKRYRFIYRHLFSSYFGVKKKIYALFDCTHLWKTNKVQNYCYYVSKLDYSVLNLEHKLWVYPVDKKIKYHYSFYDLYDIAIVKACRYIKMIDESLDDDKKIKKVLKEIGNLSYSTGVNVNASAKMQYFMN